MAAPSVRCPDCRAFGIKGDATRPRCGSCGNDWPTWGDYFRHVKSVAAAKRIRTKPVPAPPPGDDDYITSGDLAYDIEKLLEVATQDAVEKAVGDALIAFTEDLETEVRAVYKRAGSSAGHELYDLIVGRAQSLRRRLGEEEE